MTSEEYGQYIDDFELGADVMPGESLTEYIERRRREFDSKADGGSIGIEVLFKEKMADGGRAGFFMGGPALTGQPLAIYNSMNTYGFSDQEIADAIIEAGYELPKKETSISTTPITNTAPNIINQGGDGGGGGITGITYNRDDDLGTSDYQGTGPGFKEQFARAFNALKNIPTPFNIARMGIEKAIDFAKQKAAEKKEKELQDFYNSTQAAITRDIARDNKAAGTGGYQSNFAQDSDFMGGGGRDRGNDPSDAGGSDTMGSFNRGGLATMFTRRR